MPTPVIPDPEDPQARALDGETGEVLHGLRFMPMPKDGKAPTLKEIEDKAVFIGWGKPQ